MIPQGTWLSPALCSQALTLASTRNTLWWLLTHYASSPGVKIPQTHRGSKIKLCNPTHTLSSEGMDFGPQAPGGREFIILSQLLVHRINSRRVSCCRRNVNREVLPNEELQILEPLGF